MAKTGTIGDKVFRTILIIAAASILLIVTAMIFMMVSNSMPTIKEFGFGFLTGSDWKPAESIFGALAVYLRNDRFVADRTCHFRADLSRNRDISDRTSSEKNRNADRIYGRIACGDSFGCLRTLGNFRTRAVYPRLSRRVFGNISRLASAFSRSSDRNRNADGRNYSGVDDDADHYCGRPRYFGSRSDNSNAKQRLRSARRNGKRRRSFSEMPLPELPARSFSVLGVRSAKRWR